MIILVLVIYLVRQAGECSAGLADPLGWWTQGEEGVLLPRLFIQLQTGTPGCYNSGQNGMFKTEKN